MCQHSSADKLAPGICINCHMNGDAIVWIFIGFCSLFILGQLIRSWAFFATTLGII